MFLVVVFFPTVTHFFSTLYARHNTKHVSTLLNYEQLYGQGTGHGVLMEYSLLTCITIKPNDRLRDITNLYYRPLVIFT